MLHSLLVCLDCFSFPGYYWSWIFVNMVLESPGKVLEFWWTSGVRTLSWNRSMVWWWNRGGKYTNWNLYSGCCAGKHLPTMWQTGRQSSVTEKAIFRETEDKNLSKSGASSRRCVSARQRIGNYFLKLDKSWKSWGTRTRCDWAKSFDKEKSFLCYKI